MKLCIADPPYLGYASMWYGASDLTDDQSAGTLPANHARTPTYGGPASSIGAPRKADINPDAHLWDKPETHRALIARLCDEYDGWAVAMNPSNLSHYLTWTPEPHRVAAWVKPNGMPHNERPIQSWEPVIVKVPAGRRKGNGRVPTRDFLVAPKPALSFAGAKPPAWTRWVLDMLGYDAETDTVDDLFAGSGAVAAEIAQGVLL